MDMPEIRRLKENSPRPDLAPYLDELIGRAQASLAHIAAVEARGRNAGKILEQLPPLSPSVIDLDCDWVRIGRAEDASVQEQQSLFLALTALMPWRKGPFAVFGIELDSEWLSFLKWNRLKDHITPLRGRRVLDIGSSCGYYLFRMAAASPRLVLGIEPYATFYFQYLLLQHYIQAPQVYCLPLKLEQMPRMREFFDTVFCMGILYHRRSPLDTLVQIRSNMRAGAQLVVETLIIEGQEDTALLPAGRYAKMNNVFFIPTVRCLTRWLQRTGFEQIRCIDISATSSDEQRKTGWIQSQSLDAFLQPGDHSKTVEGYPAPVRAVVLTRAR
jgi:tRNA (mo5U34)-methyltransferase